MLDDGKEHPLIIMPVFHADDIPTINTLMSIIEEMEKAQIRLTAYYVSARNPSDKSEIERTEDNLRRSQRALTYLMDEIQLPVMNMLIAIHKIIGDDDDKK